jgi:hypothetical protein
MTRASGIILQALMLAIFTSSIFFFALAVGHAETKCTAEEQEYDTSHRELLGMPPGECVQALPGYPTRAAGWGAAAKAQAKQHGEAYPGILDMIDEP